jgi:hypothetical protein
MAGPARTISLVRQPDATGVGVFRITAGTRAEHYVFREIRCDIGGRGFEVHKLGLGDLYHVRVGRRRDCSCECLGFLRHGHCRHIAGLLALLRDHSLRPKGPGDEAPRPT